MFDGEFEDAILSQCLRDEAYLKQAVRICDAHHFGTKERAWLWKVVSETWSSFHERPGAKLIATRAKSDFAEEPKRKPYLSLALRLFKSKPSASKAALAELEKFVRQVNVQLALEESAKALEKGDTEAAEKALTKGARLGKTSRIYTHIKWIEEFKERQESRKYEREHPDEFTVIPTGLKKLDKALSGGGRKGEVGLVMGTTGRGKSILLNNFAHASNGREYPGVYFALEMPARQIAMRQDARWSAMRYGQFKEFDFKPSELRELTARLRRAEKQYDNMFHIISMPVKSADIRTIRQALDDLREEHDFRPSVLYIDSGDHLRAMDKTLDSYRLQQAEVYWELKRLAEEDGYLIWSSVHAGKEWAMQTATAEATSESYDKARIADLIVSINDPGAKGARKRVKVEVDDDDEDEPGEVKGFEPVEGKKTMELFLAKYRDGVSSLKIELECDFTRMLMREKGEKDEEETK